jgi:glycosyltransferase involved in cell wall biosynthesis
LKRLAIIITHPIQYYSPFFVLLAKVCELKVFYTIGKDKALSYFDPNFKREIKWDIPLLNDYAYELVTNTSKYPGSHSYKGIVNPSLINNINKFDPDIILIYGWAYHGHLSAMRYFKHKIPIWFRGDSNLLDEGNNNFKKYLRYFFLKWLYRHIDKALYVGMANKAYYKKFGIKDHQLIFAPHSVDNKRFAEDRSEEAEQLRKTLSIRSEEILILFAGKLEQKKNPELLLNAFIKMDLKTTHLLFVGNGILEENLKSKVEGLGISREGLAEKMKSAPPLDSVLNDGIKKRIHFIDFQNQSTMPVVYQACDLFCLPSQGPAETWGLAVNEAMAAGKAVLVSTKVGCAVDLIKLGVNGEIFKSDDLNDFIQKLRKLTESKIKLTEMGIQSQQIIQNWSFEKQVKAIVDNIYSDAK